uniref:Uncharacterized protein n=1 Tax=Magallana gigas TaxID=29159 RepID=A0A8W8K1N4_MAGGI
MSNLVAGVATTILNPLHTLEEEEEMGDQVKERPVIRPVRGCGSPRKTRRKSVMIDPNTNRRLSVVIPSDKGKQTPRPAPPPESHNYFGNNGNLLLSSCPPANEQSTAKF